MTMVEYSNRKNDNNQKLIIKHKTSVFIKHRLSTLKDNTSPILY